MAIRKRKGLLGPDQTKKDIDKLGKTFKKVTLAKKQDSIKSNTTLEAVFANYEPHTGNSARIHPEIHRAIKIMAVKRKLRLSRLLDELLLEQLKKILSEKEYAEILKNMAGHNLE